MFDPSSYDFSWYAVPVLFVGVANWLLGLLTLRRERGSAPSVALLVLTVPIGVWLVGLGFANATADPVVGEHWVKISLVGTAFVPAGSFVSVIGSSRTRGLHAITIAGFVCSSVFAVLVLSSDLILDEAHRYFWGYYPIYGPAGPLLMIYYGFFFALGGTIYRLGEKGTRSAIEKKRMRIRLAALAMTFPAVVDFLPTMHIGIYPFGYTFIMGYIALSTYSIWRYRMVDITPALAAKQITDTMAEGLLVVDRDGIVRVANDAAEAVWGTKSLVGRTCGDLDERWGEPALASLLDPSERDDAEVTYRAPDGMSRTVAVATSKLPDQRGEWVGTVYILHDITERARAEQGLRESEERFRSLVQNASDLITVIDPDTTIRYQSAATQRVLGIDAESTIGVKLADVVHPDDHALILTALSDLMTKPAGTVTGEGRVRDSSGEWRHLEFTGSDQRHNPAINGLVLNVRDVSERKRLEEQLRHQALHDPLTNLANRTRFTDRLDHALARRARARTHVAVLFMDLDNFKGVNDSLGHSAGDRLLTQVAERVTRCVRPEDTVARLGGDEFAVLVEDMTSPDDAIFLADRILAALQSPFHLEGKEVAIRASIGIATTAGASAPEAGALLRDADIAMYVAKSRGKACHRVYEPSMQSSLVERLELLAEMPRALERDELVLHYQPIFLLQAGGLYGVEALVRWQHPTRGLLAPQEFIPLAEESGAIHGIGRWVLDRACRQAAEWRRMFPYSGEWTISVNVSAKQLEQPSFVADVSRILADTGVEPRRLILEITETAMMHDFELMLERLRAVKELGVSLAIDDFGTGYSALGYLRQFPFDLLKIDKSFIDDLNMIVGEREVTRAIVELGKSLNMNLVAEGVESGDQLSQLRSMECELGQGFLFAKPMEREGVEELLRAASEQADAAA